VGGGSAHGVDFRVLGPLEVDVNGVVLDIGGPQLQAVLALLLAGAGRVVSVSSFVEALWGQHAPQDADRTVRTYVSRLRKALAPAAAALGTGELILTRPPGYLLLDRDIVDASRFERLAIVGGQALAAGTPAAATEQLSAALALWRGAAYGEFGAYSALNGEGMRLEQLRRNVVQDRIDADLAAGQGRELIAELEGLTAAHPEHERLWGQLMTALYRAGRQADALKAFRTARRLLVHDSGVEPSPLLTEIHRRILAQDPRLLARCELAPPRVRREGLALRPAQLPPSVPMFVGRSGELATLDVTRMATGTPGTITISALCGTAGVGKTALAVHWAQRVAAQFPDGQLYVNLHGFDPIRSALEPTEALRGFLDAFAVPAERIPNTLDAQTTLYRSLTADKRLLIVLDNAQDTEQVRPLLPSSPGSMVVVTSRDDLVGLVARDGARRVRLDVLRPDESVDLLHGLIGDRGAEQAAVVTLARQCAHLPLALRIAADLVTRHSGATIGALVGELASEQRRLDLLDAGADDSTAVRAVFSWSERHLPQATVRLFWLLGLHPGREIDAAAAAALAGVEPADARVLMAQLSRANLVEPAGTDRWTMHDLLRVFARERAAERIESAERLVALRSLYAFYLAAALDAMDAVLPATRGWRRGTQPAVSAAPITVDSECARARVWLDTERLNLIAAIEAAGGDLSGYAVSIAHALGQYLTLGFHNADAFTVHGRALAVAETLGDRTGQARALLELGRATGRSGRYADSSDYYRRSLTLFRQLGDHEGEAWSVHELGTNMNRIGQYPAALKHFRDALALHRMTGNRPGEAAAMASIGQVLCSLGQYRDVVSHFKHAATLFEWTGHRVGQGRLLNDLGNVLQRQGRYAEAHDCHERALRILHDVGDPAAEACTLNDLGRIYSKWGRHAEALGNHEQALATFRELGDRVGEVEALIELGDACERMSRHEESIGHHRQAHRLAEQLGDRHLQASALNGQGRSLSAGGHPREALLLHRAAFEHSAGIGNPEHRARSLDGMARAHELTCQYEQAHRLWTEARDIYTELDMPEADVVSRRLSTVDPGAREEVVGAAPTR
jgi:DNA-binding SARP family transcriptional activator/tetratricopeptide (TPR) repeat protein